MIFNSTALLFTAPFSWFNFSSSFVRKFHQRNTSTDAQTFFIETHKSSANIATGKRAACTSVWLRKKNKLKTAKNFRHFHNTIIIIIIIIFCHFLTKHKKNSEVEVALLSIANAATTTPSLPHETSENSWLLSNACVVDFPMGWSYRKICWKQFTWCMYAWH